MSVLASNVTAVGITAVCFIILFVFCLIAVLKVKRLKSTVKFRVVSYKVRTDENRSLYFQPRNKDNFFPLVEGINQFTIGISDNFISYCREYKLPGNKVISLKDHVVSVKARVRNGRIISIDYEANEGSKFNLNWKTFDR